MVHALRSHCVYRVDSSWDHYSFFHQEGSIYGVRVMRRYKDDQRPDTTALVDLFDDVEQIVTNLTQPKLEYPSTMDTGYHNLNLPVQGNAALSFKDSDSVEIGVLVGRHVIVNVSAFVETSTPLTQEKPTTIELDLGKLFAGAFVWLIKPYVSPNSYSRRITAVAAGVLASSLAGMWTFRISWKMYHQNAISDQFDSWAIAVDLEIAGYSATRRLTITAS